MSEHTVYAIASGKGGVGKTTTTVNLGTALAGAGNRVVVVDADIGMANLAGFVSLDGAATTLHDVLADEATIDDALYRLSYAAAETEGLTAVVDRLRDRFDYVLLDVGAGISHETVLPLGVADGVILVSTPDPASVQDARKTIELTERTNGQLVGLVVTRFRPDGNVDADAIADRLDVELLGTVPEDDAVRASIHEGTPVVVHAPQSDAAQGYKRLAARLLGSRNGDRSPAVGSTDDTTDGDEETTTGDEETANDDGETSNGDGEPPNGDEETASSDETANADEGTANGDEEADAGDGAEGVASETDVSDAIKNVDDGA
jgi:septum site-determining protein MinD